MMCIVHSFGLYNTAQTIDTRQRDIFPRTILFDLRDEETDTFEKNFVEFLVILYNFS